MVSSYASQLILEPKQSLLRARRSLGRPVKFTYNYIIKLSHATALSTTTVRGLIIFPVAEIGVERIPEYFPAGKIEKSIKKLLVILDAYGVGLGFEFAKVDAMQSTKEPTEPADKWEKPERTPRIRGSRGGNCPVRRASGLVTDRVH